MCDRLRKVGGYVEGLISAGYVLNEILVFVELDVCCEGQGAEARSLLREVGQLEGLERDLGSQRV